MSDSNPSRLTKACLRCRQAKLACRARSGDSSTCARCGDNGWECVFIERKRGFVKPSHSHKILATEAKADRVAADLESLKVRLMDYEQLRQRLELLEERLIMNQAVPPLPPPPAVSAARSVPPTTDVDALLSVQTPYIDNSGDKSSTPLGMASNHLESGLVEAVEKEELSFSAAVLNLPNQQSTISGDSPVNAKRPEEFDPYTLQQCRQAFRNFDVNCRPAVVFCDPTDANLNFERAKDLSSLLFWTIATVGARDDPQLAVFYKDAIINMFTCLRRTLGGARPTFWDVVGMMIYNKWLAPTRHIGHIVGMAYELGIHRAPESMASAATATYEEVQNVRLWLALWVQDYFGSKFTGTPNFIADAQGPIDRAQWLAMSSHSSPNDCRLLATFEYETLMKTIKVELEAGSPLTRDWQDMASFRLNAIDDWFAKWLPIGSMLSTESQMSSMLSAMKVNYYLAKLFINSIALKGVRQVEDIRLIQQTYLFGVLDNARQLCRLCVEEFAPPRLNHTGETAIHGFVTAAVLGMKAARLGAEITSSDAVLADIESAINMLRNLKDDIRASVLSALLSRIRGHPTKAMLDGITVAPPIAMGSASSSGENDVTSWTKLLDDPFEVATFQLQGYNYTGM